MNKEYILSTGIDSYNNREIIICIPKEEGPDMYYIPIANITGSKIIDTMMKIKYPTDRMQAIINNYLLDPEDEANLSEFNEMQEYRKFAKKIAKECLKYIEENNL